MPINNFTNRNTFGFDEDALATTTSGEVIRNFARLVTSDDIADGIYAGADNVAISNFDRIETSGLGAAGISVEGNGARIDNYGTVVTHASLYDPDPGGEGDELYSEGLTVLGDGYRITNYGTVRVEGDLSSAMSGIGNDGIVVNNGRLEGASHGSSLMAVFGDRAQAINNSLIAVGTEANAGMLAYGEDAAVINRGRIVMDAAQSVGMEGVIVGTHVTNAGLVRISGDGSIGLCALGDGHELTNLAQVDMRGFFAIGIEASGLEDEGLAGIGNRIVNAGSIGTVGDLAIGVTLGLTNAEAFPGFTPAAFGEIVNRGSIQTRGDGAAGVAMIGDGHHLLNQGRITADGGVYEGDPVGTFRAAGVVVSGSDTLVENAAKASIVSKDAASAAVELNVVERDGFVAESATSRLENLGTITGASVAVLGGAGQEAVVNHGRINGDVLLGAGEDTFVFGKGGSLHGDLFLGGGGDLVIVEDGAGKASVADFAADDLIDLSAFYADYAAVALNSVQSGADVVITLDGNDRLILEGVQLGDLSAGNFIFV